MMKRLLMVIACLLVIIGYVPVCAEENGETNVSEETITRISTLQEFKDFANSDIMPMSDLNLVTRIAKMNNNGHLEYISKMQLDGQLVYCIDVNIIAAFGSGYYEDYEALSWETKERLWHLIYYGYGYPGHSSDDWFVATQLLVWETMGQYVTPLDINTGGFYDVEWQKAEILSLADSGGTLPSFNGQTVEVDLNEEYVFEDSNNVLSQFSAPSAQGVTVNQNGNKLSVTINQINYQGNLSGSAGGGDNPGIVYKKGNSQDVFLASRNQPGKSYSVNVKLITGDLEITKTDEYGNNPGEGHVYEVASDEQFTKIIGSYTSDAQGIIRVHEVLPEGDYFVREKSAAYPFLVNNEIQTFHITPKETTKLESVNQFKTVGLDILKVDEEDEENLLNDTLFSVTDISDVTPTMQVSYKLKLNSVLNIEEEGCSVSDTKVLSIEDQTITGISNGESSIMCEDVTYEVEVSDEFGEEVVKEEKELLDSSLSFDEKAEIMFMGSTGKSVIRVYDPKSHNTSLAAQNIELFDEEDNSVGTFLSDGYGVIDLSSSSLEEGTYYYTYNDEKVEIAYSPATQGQLHVNGLKWGRTYMVCEITPKEGYEVTGEACSKIKLDLNQGVEIVEIKPTNKKRRIDFQLFKVDANNSGRLKGAIFNVINLTTGENLGNFYSGYFYLKSLDENNQPKAGVVYEISTVSDFSAIIHTGATDAQGELVVDLNPGKYYARVKNEENGQVRTVNVIEGGFEIQDIIWGEKIKVCEIEAPAGYHLASECHEQVINTPVGSEMQMFDFADKPIVPEEEVPVMGI